MKVGNEQVIRAISDPRIEGTGDDEWIDGLVASVNDEPAWELREVPLKILDTGHTRERDIVSDYASMDRDTRPPILVLRDLTVADGGHRAQAAMLNREKTILAYVPVGALKRNPMRALTYGDFYRTGVQDCGNVLELDEFDLDAGGTPEQIVDYTWARWEEDGLQAGWLEQQDDFEGLYPLRCYEEWRAGWKSCAVASIKQALEERAEDIDHENPPPNWWRKPTRVRDQPCYPTKSEALARFLEVNYEIVENYGGADYEVSPAEFDSINHKYDLKGKRAVKTIAGAVWAAMPVGRPYCLDRIDLDALNGISAVVHGEAVFRLPDVSYESQLAAEEARYYAPHRELADPPRRSPSGELADPSWVTDHEAVRTFPPLPPMPYRLQLEESEPGVATYRLVDEEEGERMPGPPPPAPQLTKPSDFVPYRLQLEEGEPGVERYKLNPADKVKIKMTSTRSGKVGWIRPDGTPSDHESEAGRFDPAEADAVIAEYTENLVRVVGRCANRFEALPISNPASSWRVWIDGSPNSYVNVDASNAIQAMMHAAPKFAPGPLFRFAGARDSAVMFALPQGETTWRTSRKPVEKLVTIDHDGRLAFHPRGEDMSKSNPGSEPRWRVWFSEAPDSYVTVTAGGYMDAMRRAAPQFRGAHDNETREMIAKIDGGRAIEALVTVGREGRLTFHPSPSRGNPPPKDNPAWVTKILSKHFDKLGQSVPAKWLPKLTNMKAVKGKVSASMKEYGCGAYGCVLPTLDPKVVLKLTTDDTEAQFANELADTLAAPVVVKYHMALGLPDVYKGRNSFLLWRDAADHVGDLAVVVSERGGDGIEAEDAIDTQHKAAQDAYEALHDGKPAGDLLKKWEVAARAMGQKVPELHELAEGMITNLKKNKIFMGDVHGGNIGRVGNRWVVVDPGHIAVLEA